MGKLLKKEKIALAEFKKRLKKGLGKQLVKVILFGSKARGDARKDSDIDVLVVVRRDSEKIRDFVNNTKMDINDEYDFKLFISAKVYSVKEYNYYKSIPTIFIQNILFDGIEL